jgi:hypothetical protein
MGIQANPRYFYSEYVNHMIRFYLSCPESISLSGHSQADLSNWLAVQAIYADLSDDDKQLVKELYGTRRPYSEAVNEYAAAHKLKVNSVWQTVVRISNKIARQRGLI